MPDAGRVAPKLLGSRRNERIKLVAGALDRLSTVVIGGAVLAPLIQEQQTSLVRIAIWGATALILHVMAQFALSRLEEEA